MIAKAIARLNSHATSKLPQHRVWSLAVVQRAHSTDAPKQSPSSEPGRSTYVKERSRTRLYSQTAATDPSEEAAPDLPLSGVKVLELGQLIAGPFAGQLLGHFGAEVIKVEPPNLGDPLRVWREIDVDGTSPWFRSIGRNKKSITIDLRKPEGREVVRELALKSDVIIENFKPGTLEKWNLGPAALHPHNPELIFTRVSGYGQSGPWSKRPGYASVCEAESGFRYVNGFPDLQTGGLDGPPVRPNISLGDSVAGLHAAFGTVLALLARRKKLDQGKPAGQVVDVSIVESMLNLMEGTIPEYDRKQEIRGPSGSSITGIVPTNAYPCLPDPITHQPNYIIIGANGDTIYTRLMTLIQRTDLLGPAYAQNHNRVSHVQEIEDAIRAWTSVRSVDEAFGELDGAGVPVGKVASVRDVVQEKHWAERGAVEDVWVEGDSEAMDVEGKEGWSVKMPGVFPIVHSMEAAGQGGLHPKTRWAGPDLGAHTEEVLSSVLGLDKDEIEKLRKSEII